MLIFAGLMARQYLEKSRKKLLDVPGDGSCFFHAVAHQVWRLEKRIIDPFSLRSHVLDNLDKAPMLVVSRSMPSFLKFLPFPSLSLNYAVVC